MSVFLKNNWRSRNGKKSELADFLNRIADLFNYASVPSGGTAQPTTTGFQIEVDSESVKHFGVYRTSTTELTVRGGWWAYYDAEVRTQVDLSDGSAGTITDAEDVLVVDLTVAASGFVYLELDTTASPATLEAVYAASIPSNAAGKYRKKIATVTWDTDHISEIKQDWTGGNILTMNGAGENDHSFHFTSTGATSGTVEAGYYRQGSATSGSLLPTKSTLPTNFVLDAGETFRTIVVAANKKFYIKVDWTTSTATNIAPVVTWESHASAVPDNTTDIEYIPVLDFDSASQCRERLQSDLTLPNVHIPKPSGLDAGVLVYNAATGDIEWLYSSYAGDLLRKDLTTNTLVWDNPVANISPP